MKQQFAAKHPWTILAAGAAIQVLTGLPAAWGVFGSLEFFSGLFGC